MKKLQSIRARVTTLAVIGVVVTFVLGGLSFVFMSSSKHGTDSVSRFGEATRVVVLSDMYHDGIRAAVFSAFLSQNSTPVSEALAEVQEFGRKMEAALAEARDLVRFATVTDEINSVLPEVKKYRNLAEATLSDELNVSERRVAIDSFVAQFRALEERLPVAADLIDAASLKNAKDFKATEGQHKIEITVFALVAMFSLGVFAFSTIRRIIRALNGVSLVLTDVVNDGMLDLTVRFDDSGNTEISEVAVRLNLLMTQMRTAMGNVSDYSTSLSGAAIELSSVSTQLASSATQTSSQVTNAELSISRIHQEVQLVEEGGSEMYAAIREISKNASGALEHAGRAVDVVASSSKTISALGEVSNEIGEVIKVIAGIASQTNLLALNATIEAARAGSAGKGFAVVAEEVKALAVETGSATASISEQIDAVQKGIGSAIQAIGEVSIIVREINAAQESIAAAVEEQTATTNQIAAGAKSAVDSAQAVSTSMGDVAASAGITKDGSESTYQSSQELAMLAGQMNALVSSFKV